MLSVSQRLDPLFRPPYVPGCVWRWVSGWGWGLFSGWDERMWLPAHER